MTCINPTCILNCYALIYYYKLYNMIRLDQKKGRVGVLFSYLKMANSSKVEISTKDGQLHFHLKKPKQQQLLSFMFGKGPEAEFGPLKFSMSYQQLSVYPELVSFL